MEDRLAEDGGGVFVDDTGVTATERDKRRCPSDRSGRVWSFICRPNVDWNVEFNVAASIESMACCNRWDWIFLAMVPRPWKWKKEGVAWRKVYYCDGSVGGVIMVWWQRWRLFDGTWDWREIFRWSACERWKGVRHTGNRLSPDAIMGTGCLLM
jgi:hypothetical protein